MTKEGKYKRLKPNEYVAKAAPLKLPKHDATSDEKSNEGNKEEHAVEIEKKKTAKKVQQKKATAKLTNSKNQGGKVRILGSIAHLLCHNNYPFIILTKTITYEIYHK